MLQVKRLDRSIHRLARIWRHRGLLIIAAVVAAAPVYAAVGLSTSEMEEKAIRVENPEQEPLQVSLEPARPSFKVNEPISFKIRGNKPFFLYLYSIDKKTEAATLILPTKEGQQQNKYPGGETLVVPNQGEAAFLADEAGHEKLVMVASTKYLPVKSAWFRKGADRYVGKAEEFEKEFAEKGIRVRGPEKTQDANVQVKTIAVQIAGETRSGDTTAAASPVWLTTKGNRQDYAIGEPIEAVFGAEQDGWIHLYVIEPNGKYSRLKSYAVKGNASYTMKAVAEDPTGKHALVAVYTRDDKPTKALGDGDSEKSMALLDASPKGVRLEEEKPVPMAVYRFQISDR